MPSIGQMVLDKKREIARLEKELGRAYRAIFGFYNKVKKGELPDATMIGTHSPKRGGMPTNSHPVKETATSPTLAGSAKSES